MHAVCKAYKACQFQVNIFPKSTFWRFIISAAAITQDSNTPPHSNTPPILIYLSSVACFGAGNAHADHRSDVQMFA